MIYEEVESVFAGKKIEKYKNQHVKNIIN